MAKITMSWATAGKPQAHGRTMSTRWSVGPKAKAQSDINPSSATTLAQAMGKPVKIASPGPVGLTLGEGQGRPPGGNLGSRWTPMKKPVKTAAPDLSALRRRRKAKAASDGAADRRGPRIGHQRQRRAPPSPPRTRLPPRLRRPCPTPCRSTPRRRSRRRSARRAVEGLVVGLEGGQAAVTAAAQALGKQTAKAADVTAIDNAIAKGITYAGKDSALVKFLKGDQAKLLTLAAKRTALETEITDSTQIATQAISNANITSAGTYTPVLAASSGPLAASATITGLQQMAADQAQFASVIGQLGKGGLNATSLNQFVQAGASSLPQALGLEQGGKGAIGQVNKLESQIQSSAAKLGDAGGPAMYQAGVQAGQGLAQGIKSQLGTVTAAIQQLAQPITTAIKKALNSHSPSRW